jgi:succinoglycan biosynthesis protein ExoM
MSELPSLVSVIIPTQRRPQGLETAVRSIMAQEGAKNFELVVVDNDQVPSAQASVEMLARAAPIPVVYVHEPAAGVANARNAAMAKAKGDLIAFLDDDEEAPVGWLAALIAAQARYQADVVFGPVRARAPLEVGPHHAYLEWFFSRLGPGESGVIADYYGCGDSLLVRASLPDPVVPFSASRNHSGGEDDLLFGQMKERGARFAWAPDAWVWEDPVPQRLTLGYTIRRAFGYGQGPTQACAAQTPPDLLGIARWMLIGMAQVGVYGLLAAFQKMVGSPRRAFTLDRAARGLGKVLWWSQFKISFYGQSTPV